MTISRRRLLSDGVRATAALAVGPTLFRLHGCGRSRTIGSAKVCVGASSAAPVEAPGPPLVPSKLARFVDRLPIPPVLEPEGTRPDPDDPKRQIAHYRVVMRESEQQVHRDVPPTRFWSYGGTVPGPTIETRSGKGFLVEWVNELPERHFLPIDHGLHGAHEDVPEVRAVVHVHGAKVPPASDGHPEAWFTRGQSATYHYPNRQDAAMLWYHDHAMGIERLNMYAGLFGVLLVRDDVEDRLGLPRGPYEIPLVLCDRLLKADGHLRYPTSGVRDSPWVSEVYGDATLVNGKFYPYVEVEPRPYRFRVVNAANSRFFYLARSDRKSFHQIGSDQGLLQAPAQLSNLTLAPAERADVLIDFSDMAGQKIVLQNQMEPLLEFRVSSGPAAASKPLPARLRAIERTPRTAAVRTRTFALNEYMDPQTHRMLMLLDDKYWRDPVSEKPVLGSVEIWELMNLTEDVHPIHLHLVRFQVLERQLFDADRFLLNGTLRTLGKPRLPEAGELGWKDTVRADPGAITRIIVKFDGYPGRYVWHCHLPEHAANEMMRPFEVVLPA
jgi:spore coat protein A